MDNTILFHNVVSALQPATEFHLEEKEISPLLKTGSSLAAALFELHNSLTETRHEYLLVSSPAGPKDKFDAFTKLHIQQLSSQITQLDKAIKKAYPNDLPSSSPLAWTRSLLSLGDYGEWVHKKHLQESIFYNNLVAALTLRLSNCATYWQTMRDQRLAIMDQLNKSSQANANISLNVNYTPKITEQYTNLMSSLPEQELQQLQVEQENLLLEIKQDTISQVDQIGATMVDIATMVNEIGVQLSTQNSMLRDLENDQDVIDGNISSGNQILRKSSSKKRGQTTATIIISLALLLLLIDYIL